MIRSVWASVLIAGLATANGIAARGQTPERKQDVRVPGTDQRLLSGWEMFVYQGCRIAVPASWHRAADGDTATAPDGSNVSVRVFNITSWTAHKVRIKAAFGRVNVVHDDSERRLWFEIGDKPRVQHYVDVLNGATVCSALVEMRSAAGDAEDTARRIAESVSAAPNTL